MLGAVTLAIIANIWTVDRLTNTDDLIFLTAVLGKTEDGPGVYDLSAWLAWRYEHWSGRVIPEAWTWIFTPAPLAAWKAFSVVLWLGTVLLAVRFLTVLRPASGWLVRSGFAIAAFSVVFLMHQGALMWGAFWVTGAIFYWWVVPFALAALLPAAEVLFRGRAPHPVVLVLSALAAGIAGASGEQPAAIVVALGVLATGYRLFQVRKGSAEGGVRATIAVVIPTLLSIVGAIILFAAPGNAVRSAVDEITWLPGFFDAPLSQRLQGGLQFTVDGLVNQSGLLLILIWLVLLVLIIRSGRSTRLVWFAGAVPVLALAFTAGSAFLDLQRLTQFNPYWQDNPTGPEGILILVVWTALIIGTVLIPILLRRDVVGFTQSLLMAAAVAATFVTSFSPSMYASGDRVHFIPSVVLAIVLLALLPAVFKGRRPALVIAAASPVVLLAALACFQLMVYRWTLG